MPRERVRLAPEVDEESTSADDLLERLTPVLACESRKDFDRLRHAMGGDIKPTNFIEKMYVREAVSLFWELLRWRQQKTDLLNRGLRYKLAAQLEQMVADEQQRAAWRERIASAVCGEDNYRSICQELGLELEEIMLELHREFSADLAVIDRGISNDEKRRDKAIDRIHKYRKAFAVKPERADQNAPPMAGVPVSRRGEGAHGATN